jgi:hypothetical protein
MVLSPKLTAVIGLRPVRTFEVVQGLSPQARARMLRSMRLVAVAFKRGQIPGQGMDMAAAVRGCGFLGKGL